MSRRHAKRRTEAAPSEGGATLDAMPKAELAGSKVTCQGTTKAGNECQSTLVGSDGYCIVHSPTKRFDPVVTGRAGGLKSGETRRALAKSARERLRELAENDDAMWRKVKAAYEDGLEALGPDGMPDFRGRVQAADAFLAQAYGKPVQTIAGDHGINIVIAGALEPRALIAVDAASREQPVQPRRLAALPAAGETGDPA